jgi:hypothetical protein
VVFGELQRAKEIGTQDSLNLYAQARREYKNLLKEKRKIHIEQEAKKIAEAATNDPYRVLRATQPRFPSAIPIQAWETHFGRILNT